MKPAVKVFKSSHSPHWLVADARVFWPIISAHDTHAEAIRAAHKWATERATERAEEIAAVTARWMTGYPA